MCLSAFSPPWKSILETKEQVLQEKDIAAVWAGVRESGQENGRMTDQKSARHTQT